MAANVNPSGSRQSVNTTSDVSLARSPSLFSYLPGAMPSVAPNTYEIGMYEVTQQLHSQLPPTRVWGYGTSQATASYPAATIEAQCDVPIRVKWTNNLPEEHLLEDAIDRTLHMAMWEEGVPAVVHVHGSEVEPQSDGGPDAWISNWAGGVRQGLLDAGYSGAGEVFRWNTGLGVVPDQEASAEYKRSKAAECAQSIQQYAREHPGAPER